MKAEDKKTLYKFFLTASAYISGFKTEEIEPVFSDDFTKPEEPIIQPVKTQKDMVRIPGLSGVSERASKEAVGDVFFSADNEMPYKKEPENQALNLLRIYKEISVCRACRLCERRKNTVPGEGPENFQGGLYSNAEGQNAFSQLNEKIEVMVIGEGPGADEDAQGRPFVGRAGQLLDKMLAAIQLFRTHNCYITNVVKCRPPNNRDPLPDETASCRGFLDGQIAIIKPKAILVVGRVALQNLLHISDGIGKMHGRFLEYNGIPLMATYHPSALLRDENLKRPTWEDLKLFRSKLNEIKNTF